MTILFPLAVLLAVPAGADVDVNTAFGAEDVARVAEITDPVFSPDEARVIYTLTTSDGEKDAEVSDLWAARWDGGAPVNLTRTPGISEWLASVTADGRRIAFLSDRGDDEETQLWTMPMRGGRASRVGSATTACPPTAASRSSLAK